MGLNDLYAIGCTSKYFECLVGACNRRFDHTLDTINNKDVHRFLKTVGAHIRRLNIAVTDDCDYNTVINFFIDVQHYCTNIKHLTIRKWTYLNFDKLELLVSRLATLRLENCRYYDKMDVMHRRLAINPWIIAPSSFFSLCAPTMKPAFFSSLASITSLQLYECSGIRPELLLDYLKKNERLTDISLFRLTEFNKPMYDAAFFDEIGKHLKYVERFSVDRDTTNEIQFLDHLPNLRSLQLINYTSCDERVVDALLRKLAKHDLIEQLDLYHCNISAPTFTIISRFSNMTGFKLCKNFWVTEQHLKVLFPMKSLKRFCCFDCTLLSDEGLVNILRMAPQLEALDCSWCFQLTNRFVYDLFELFKNDRRPELAILVGGRTKMTESILDVSINY